MRHIDNVDDTVVSFGQGCEGEPLVNGDLLESAIRLIREKTDKGTINLNTNASRPAVVDRLIDSGLDSIRVSLNSLREDLYTAYYRPKGYTFAKVIETLKLCTRRKIHTSLNFLYFPGVSDTPSEIGVLTEFLGDCGVDLIQMRNLNIDPELYVQSIPVDYCGKGVGLRQFLQDLKEKFPDLRFGYFNPSKEAARRGD